MRWGCWGWGLAVVEGAHAGYWNRGGWTTDGVEVTNVWTCIFLI